MYPDGVVKSVGDVLLSRVSHGTITSHGDSGFGAMVVMVTVVLRI